MCCRHVWLLSCLVLVVRVPLYFTSRKKPESHPPQALFFLAHAQLESKQSEAIIDRPCFAQVWVSRTSCFKEPRPLHFLFISREEAPKLTSKVLHRLTDIHGLETLKQHHPEKVGLFEESKESKDPQSFSSCDCQHLLLPVPCLNLCLLYLMSQLGTPYLSRVKAELSPALELKVRIPFAVSSKSKRPWWVRDQSV